ncbi:MAG: hypothetical protein MUD01_08075 [Chloroflexaceae bacterium]|jgi:hypothetical protein|nr:hypothetical protein [Chloroflexaceae bacterium]
MTSYNRPRLTTLDDKRYRAYNEQFILQRKNNRAMRPPRQRDIFGGQAEEALRNWLATQVQLSDRRILEYEERRGSRATMKYRELDAIALEQRSAWVFEIKASRTASALRKAVGQLEETRAILRLLYHRVDVTVLLVDTGIPANAEEVAALMAGPTPPPRPPELLDDVLAALPQLRLIGGLDERSNDGKTIDLVRFSVEDIVAMAGAENLALDWSQDDLIEDYVPPKNEGPLYSTGDDEAQSSGDDDDNPLAAALRRAGLK